MSFASKGFVISEIQKRLAGVSGFELSGNVTAAASTVLDLTTTGALAFGTTGNDPRLVRGGNDILDLNDGDGNKGGLRLLSATFTDGTNTRFSVSTTSQAITGGSATKWGWSSGGSVGAQDTALSRAAAGILFVEDGSGNPAAIRNKVSCVTSLATAAAPTLITPGQTNTYFDNDGGTAIHYFTMPTTWVRGLQYHFTCVTSATSVGIRIQCSPNQTIVVGTAVTTTTSGYIEASDRGSHITLTAITSGTYWATGGVIGSWDVV